MQELLLGIILLVMFFTGMIWLGFRAGLFQGFVEEVKGWKQDYSEWKFQRKIEKEQKKKRARK